MSPQWLRIGTRARLLLEQRSAMRSLQRERIRKGPDPFGSADCIISVGPYRVARTSNDRLELMAVLRDDALTMAPGGPTGPEMVITMAGQQVADRLDFVGIDGAAVCAAFDDLISRKLAALTSKTLDADEARPTSDQMAESPPWLREQEYEALRGLDCQTWIARTRAAAAAAEPSRRKFVIGPEPANFWWLLSIISGLTGLEDPVAKLRLVLLVFPNEQVTVRVRNLNDGWIARSPMTAPSHALRAMQGLGSTYSPTVVLTEGRTDAKFLDDGLRVLYPHLEDLVRFMDFDAKNEGSASGLVRTVRSFIAAGVSNRIVAVFDNDSAAEDAMRALASAEIPENVVIMQYPPLELAECYPTYGPPNSDSPGGVLSTANVNGLAGSIELYLGRDVLTDADGGLRPVQWRSLIAGVKRYQGEVTGKGEIQRLFRVKAEAARNHGGPLPQQDWTGLRAILEQIIHAHQVSSPGAEPWQEN